jgi:hypothetical protein
MSILQDLKNTKDWSIRYGLWDKLFIGSYLFQELSQLDSDTIDEAVLTMQHSHASAQVEDQRAEWEWSTARSLLTCAQVAYLSERTPDRLQQLLCELNPDAQVPNRLDSDWQEVVKRSIYQFAWPRPFRAEWAWDAVAAFAKRPRRVLRTVNIAMLLLENNEGITADLTLELIDKGRGVLYANPEMMSFVLLGETFRKAEQNAENFIRGQGLWPRTEDIRWAIARKNHEPIFEINGGSSGGAFGLGLAKLLSGED